MAEAQATAGSDLQVLLARPPTGEAELSAMDGQVALSPWAFQQSVVALGGWAPRARFGAVLAAMAIGAVQRGDVRLAAFCWRATVQEGPENGDPSLGEAARARLAALGVPAGPDVSVSVRTALHRMKGSPQLLTAGRLAASLAEGHGRLGRGRLSSVRFPDSGPARPPEAWISDAYTMYADVVQVGGGPVPVVDVSLVLLHLCDRDAAVALAMGETGCRAALLGEQREAGREVRRWAAAVGPGNLIVTSTHPLRSGEADDGPTVTSARWDATGTEAILGHADGSVSAWNHASGYPPGFQQVVTGARLVGLAEGGGGPVRAAERCGTVVIAAGDQLRVIGAALGPTSGSYVDVRSLGTTEVADLAAALSSDGAVVLLRLLRAAYVGVPLEALADAGAAVALAAGRDGDEPVLALGDDAGGLTVRWPNAAQALRRQITSGPVRQVAIGQALGAIACGGGLEGAVVVTRVGDGGLDAIFPVGGDVVDIDVRTVGDRPMLTIVDATGRISIWDLLDVVELGPASADFGNAAGARLGRVPDLRVPRVPATTAAPLAALLVRRPDGAAEIRILAWAHRADETPAYRSDDVSVARRMAAGSDPLGREAEAEALAEVITSTTVQPPLAIGLFGDWGEGKTWFMGRIGAHVETRADAAAEGARPGTCANVRQVTFNAWHYAETDLWASLVAEIFSQLGRTETGDEQRRQARLRAELVRRTEVPRRLEEVRRFVRDLDEDLHRRVLPEYAGLPDRVREAWKEAVRGTDPEAAYEKLRTGASAVRRRWSGPWRVGLALARNRPGALAAAAGLVALAVVGVALAATHTPAWLGGVLVAVAGAVATAKPVVDGGRRGWSALSGHVEHERAEAETTRKVAAAEQRQLEDEYERLVGAGQLAGVLERRVKDGSYRSRLGLMSQIRHDFVEMADLLRSSGSTAGTDEGFPAIDRIVLYVDDLDRCPPARVVEVLEAIHLLLAVPLFVVVVAVDPRWLLRALTTHYRSLLGPGADVPAQGEGDADLWRSTPMHYLEKIFQIPLTLPPLDTVRYGRFVDDLLAAVGVEPVESPPAPVGDLLQEIFAASDGAVGTDATEAPGLTSARIRPFPADGAVLPAPPRTELANTLRLDPAEQSFLKLLGPPLISSPRSIKRLLNSYNLILAIEGPQGRPAVLGPVDAGGGRLVFPHRAALTILAVVIAFPEAAPGFAVHLHRAAAAKRWTDLLAEARFLGRGAEAIVDALDALTDAAATLDMALPELVGDWHPWIVKAGRLSFETGRVVVRLGDRG